MNAILIARVSTEEQKEANNSLPAQVARLEKYCGNRGFNVIKSFSFDESAYKNQREEFDTILDFVITQKEKLAVCCDKVDRLSRNIFDKRISILYEKALKDELELHFISDGQIVTSRISAVEKFQFGISLGLAKYYSDAISDNVRRAIEQKLRRGECITKVPYGYKNIINEAGKKDVIVDEYASQIVKKAFEFYATGAFSLALLSEKLKRDYGVNWSISYIDKVFNNPFYYGIMAVKDGMYPHRYPPLITKTLFEQVQTIKTGANKKRFKFDGSVPFLYRGIFRCATCDLAITPERHKGHAYYHCTQYNGKHGATWFREEKLTEKLAGIFKNLQMPPEISKQITDTLEDLHKSKLEFHQKHFSKLMREHKEITAMMDNLYIDKLKDRITESAYDKFYQTFRDQINEVSLKLEQLEEADNNFEITAKYILELTNRAHELFIGSEVEEKRQLIKLVLSNLRIDGENIVYEAQTPFDLILKCSDDQEWRP